MVFILACVVAYMGNIPGVTDADGNTTGGNDYWARAILEHATLLLGLATFAHILNYSYGGKFNPVFPLMFLGPAVAGLLNLFGAFGKMGENSLAAISIIARSSSAPAAAWPSTRCTCR